MQVTQIYELMNTVAQEVLGKSELVAEDLSNVVDMGNEVFNSNQVDQYVKSLVNHIGKVIFVNRPYRGSVPSVLMDGWEYGSVLEKIAAELPQATENESWNLEDGQSYDPNVFYQPKASAKFYNSKVTFEIPMSFTELQVKQSFSNEGQLNGFLSMIENSVDKALNIRMDSLIMRTINNMIAETLVADYPDGNYGAKSGIKAVNLLYMYNEKFSETLTAEECLTNPAFIRYASFMIGLYVDRLSKISTLFNVGAKERFTSKNVLHLVMLSEFSKAANIYLQSDTFHNELTRIPAHETVPYWQGTGIGYDFTDTSALNIKTSAGNTVNTNGILAAMFDRDSLGVANTDRRVTSNYNAKAEFYTNFYKFDSSYFNDLNENFVVFFVANAAA